MKIVKDVENKLLARREVEASVENTGATLTRDEIKKSIAKLLKVKEDLVIVNHAGNYFGNSNMNIVAKVYDNAEAVKRNARPHMVKRNTKVVEKGEGEE